MSAPVYAVMMCGHTTPEVEAKWGDYGDMAETLLKDSDKEETWAKYNVCDSQFPTDEEFLRFKGIVITGSKHDAFADDPWIRKLRSLMKRESERGQRILGICFGWQLLAVALGGKAGRADCGWEAGSLPITLLPEFFRQPFASVVSPDWKCVVHETHRDQVLQLPPGAELLASSSNTPNEIWRHGSNVLAVQGHPEFSVPFQHALNQYRVENGSMKLEDKVEAEAAMKKFPVTQQNAKELANILKTFLKS